jgi:hypothetical protein
MPSRAAGHRKKSSAAVDSLAVQQAKHLGRLKADPLVSKSETPEGLSP